MDHMEMIHNLEEEEEEEEDVFYSPKRDDEEKDDLETKRLCLMRVSVENQDPSCKDIDNSTLRRFLRARDNHVEKASKMLMKYLEWRRTFVPKGFIAASEVPNQISQNKMFMQGRDKQGRPIAVTLCCRHLPCKGDIDEFRRFLVFSLDRLCSRIPEGEEKFTVIQDLKGYGYCNSDVRGSMAAISILQEYYPERLGKAYIIHVPYIFMTMWKIIYPFIDKNTRKKIVFVEDKRLYPTLINDIDESQLPEIYGGKQKLVPIHDC